jgi:hypothetical protein
LSAPLPVERSASLDDAEHRSTLVGIVATLRRFNR